MFDRSGCTVVTGAKLDCTEAYLQTGLVPGHIPASPQPTASESYHSGGEWLGCQRCISCRCGRIDAGHAGVREALGRDDEEGSVLPGEEHHSRDKDTEVLPEDKSEPEGGIEEVLWRSKGVLLESEKGDEEKMNEELEYHKALQLVYEKVMGPWQEGVEL